MDENLSLSNELNKKIQDEEVRGYHETMYVTKSGASAVNSGSTGSLSGYAYYSASCTSGTMKVTVQYYDSTNQTYTNLVSHTISSGESFSNKSAHEGGIRMFRLVLSGWSGRGEGSIQGYN